MPTSQRAFTVRATARIPYTLYYGTFVDTPVLGEMRIARNTLVGVNGAGEIDFLERNYDEQEHGMSALQYFATKRREHQGVLELQASSSSYPRHRYGYNFDFVDHSDDPCKFFFPGFVDTHIHASQYPNIGIGLDVPLLDWLSAYTFPLEKRFTDAEEKLHLAHLIYTKVIKKTLANGTTCASYFTTTDADTTNLFGELLLEHGQRGFVGKVCMDHNDTYPDYQEDIVSCKKAMAHLVEHMAEINPDQEVLVQPIVTPRFAPVCSGELMSFLGTLAKNHRIPVQTHISENLKEIDLVRELFPDSKSYADVYDTHGLLTDRTILAHAIHLSPNERELVKSRKCSISHCPTSNTFISSGEAPVRRYLYEDSINVSLGTDVSGGFDASILGVLKSSILVSHHLAMRTGSDADKLGLADGLYMASMGGAAAVGMADTIGSFDVGKRFDAQLIDLESGGSNVDVFEWQKKDVEGLLGKWVFGGDDRNCVKVWCNGRVVVNKVREDRWVVVSE